MQAYEVNKDLLNSKIGLVSKITNQIVTTVFSTKTKTKSKLVDNVKGIVVKYELEDNLDNTFELIENKMVIVNRHSDAESKAVLVANIYDEDGTTLLLVHKWDLLLLSVTESAGIKDEELHYNYNTLSQKLCYVAILFLLLSIFVTLNTVKYSFTVSFVYVLVNIAIFLVGFLSSEKIKAHKKGYSYVLLVLGALSFIMIFIFPLQTIINYGDYVASGYTSSSFLGAAITDSTNVSNLLTQNGYVRAVIMIILLAVSTASFVVAGVVGYIKSTKLEKYLANQSVIKGN